MERIIGYDKKELIVYYQPSLIDTFFGETTRTTFMLMLGLIHYQQTLNG